MLFLMFAASAILILATIILIVKSSRPIGGDEDVHCECKTSRTPAYEVGHYGKRCGDCHGLIP